MATQNKIDIMNFYWTVEYLYVSIILQNVYLQITIHYTDFWLASQILIDITASFYFSKDLYIAFHTEWTFHMALYALEACIPRLLLHEALVCLLLVSKQLGYCLLRQNWSVFSVCRTTLTSVELLREKHANSA